MSRVFETTDLEVAAHMLRGAYGELRISVLDDQRGMRLTQDQLTPQVRFDHSTFAMNFDVTGPPLGLLPVVQVRGGQVACGSADGDGDGQRRYRSGDVFLAVQPEQAYAGQSLRADLELTLIDPALPSQLVDTEPGRAQQPVRFTGYEPVSARAGRQWAAAAAYVRDTVLAKPGAAGQPLVARSAARLLVATALAVFPHNALTGPTRQDRRDAHSETLRRAVAFIDEHAHIDITVADIAAAASVTPRAVQLVFRRHLDQSPLQYLRQIRLERAHQDLAAADPSRASVTTVAYRWGFASSSRFANYYRQAYGVAPSHTLRQD
jgi:AraC-like DNA-binding protein